MRGAISALLFGPFQFPRREGASGMGGRSGHGRLHGEVWMRQEPDGIRPGASRCRDGWSGVDTRGDRALRRRQRPRNADTSRIPHLADSCGVPLTPERAMGGASSASGGLRPGDQGPDSRSPRGRPRAGFCNKCTRSAMLGPHGPSRPSSYAGPPPTASAGREIGAMFVRCPATSMAPGQRDAAAESSMSRPGHPARGLSPRVRGNQMRRQEQSTRAGSIPACAGEPHLR